jgi:hypothetical protein
MAETLGEGNKIILVILWINSLTLTDKSNDSSSNKIDKTDF